MKPLRFYLDTSVFGGCYDAEFSDGSNRLMDAVRAGRCVAVVSSVVLEELAPAPQAVQAILNGLPPDCLELAALTTEVEALRDAYIRHGVLTSKSLYDATHVALATYHRVDAIISWNFKHIVRFDRMRGYSGVNILMGYTALTIISPQEVTFDDD